MHKSAHTGVPPLFRGPMPRYAQLADVFRQRIVMPVEGFVRSFALMAQVMQQLEKQGVIARQPAGATDAAEAAAAAPPRPTSKNFK